MTRLLAFLTAAAAAGVLLGSCDALRYFGPDRAGQSQMDERCDRMKEAAPEIRVAVYPIRIGDRVDREGAAYLAGLLTENGLCKATVAKEEVWFPLRRSMNEQSPLWEMARKFRDHVRAHPPDADYALYADYMLSPEGDRAFAVHFAVCERGGEWVMVEFQNSHHREFKKISPRTRDDCSRLVEVCFADSLD